MEILLLFVSLLSSSLASSANVVDTGPIASTVLDGANVCIDQRQENRTVNVTYLASERVKEWEWCVKLPPKCPVWRDRMVTR